MNETSNFLETLQTHCEAIARTNTLNKSAVFEALSASGITRVHVNFDGEGDNGQIEFVEAMANGQPREFPATIVMLHRTSFGSDASTAHEVTLREGVEELCYGYLEQEHGGWENDDGAFGEFTFDVAERRIELDFNGRFTDYAHSSHDF